MITLDKFFRSGFFTDKKPKDIRKEHPEKIEVANISGKGLVKLIDKLKYGQHIELKASIIPKEWEEYFRNKFPEKKMTQSEIVYHGKGCIIKLCGNPLEVLEVYLTRKSKPYPYYGWFGEKHELITFRVASIFEAANIYNNLEILDERIHTKGTGREVCCTVPSATQYDIAPCYELKIIALPSEGPCEWMDTKPKCKCNYVDNGSVIHYRDEWCKHSIAGLWEAKKNGHIPYNIFPMPTKNGEEFYRKLKDQVVLDNRNLTLTEKDVLLQEADLRSLLRFNEV